MKISIFGMGYVGCVSAACLAEAGHEVVGVDVNPLKVDMVNRGKSPVIEKDLDGLIRTAVSAGRLRAAASIGASAGRISAARLASPYCRGRRRSAGSGMRRAAAR